MEYARRLLEEIGLGADRLAMYEIAASDAPKWVAAVKEMTEKAKELGPNPLSAGREHVAVDALEREIPEMVVAG